MHKTHKNKIIQKYAIYLDKIIIIQSIFRGFLVRKKFRLTSDYFTFKILTKLLDKFIKYTAFISKINKILKNKKIRNPNFPSEISENIVKYAILKKYKICPMWDIKSGDLLIKNRFINKKMEVKAFSSNGLTSFGPNEHWNYIYFVDATKYKSKYFIVYEIKLSSDNMIFLNIKMNKNETFKDHCKQKRRPRICFSELKKQLKKYINMIFKGYIDQLIS